MIKNDIFNKSLFAKASFIKNLRSRKRGFPPSLILSPNVCNDQVGYRWKALNLGLPHGWQEPEYLGPSRALGERSLD